MKKTHKPDPQLRQQLEALGKKYDEAANNNDAAAIAALYAEDAVEWSYTALPESGDPFQLKGYWSSIDTREGNDWRIKMLTWNQTPAPTTQRQSKRVWPFLGVRLGLRKFRDLWD